VQRERLPWLGRLARLAERWRVHIAEGVFGDDYRRLLARARIVYNRSARREINRRVGETAAAGALLFQEDDNSEVPGLLRDGQEYIAYSADNLEERLTYYLEHEDERQAIAAAGHQKVSAYSFEPLWQEQLDQIEAGWEQLVESVP
jgi:spore maturation protein CgeB